MLTSGRTNGVVQFVGRRFIKVFQEVKQVVRIAFLSRPQGTDRQFVIRGRKVVVPGYAHFDPNNDEDVQAIYDGLVSHDMSLKGQPLSSSTLDNFLTLYYQTAGMKVLNTKPNHPGYSGIMEGQRAALIAAVEKKWGYVRQVRKARATTVQAYASLVHPRPAHH